MQDPFDSSKLLRFPGVIDEWMQTGYTSAPIVVDMDLTNNCPHNCPRCPGEWRIDPEAQLTTEDAIDYIRQFAEMGTKAISFGGGGDPLAHPDCATIVEVAHAMGLHTAVITNAQAMTDESAERLAVVCDWIRVSLDAATPKMFKRTHGVSEYCFDEVCARIKRLSETKTNAIIGVGFLTDANTESEMLDAAKLVKSLGADYIQYRPYNHDLTDVSETIRQAQALYEGDGFNVFASWAKYREMTEGYTKPYCKCHFHHFGTVVNARGELHLCCDMRRPVGFIGSLKVQRAKAIWDDHELRDKAEECIDLSKCPPLCRGNAHNITLDKIADPVIHEVFL